MEETLDELDAKGNVRKFPEVARDAISFTRPGEGKRLERAARVAQSSTTVPTASAHPCNSFQELAELIPHS
jgi:hypothetical protein